MPYNVEATERIKFTDTVFTSASIAATSSKQTGTIDMGNFRRLVVLASVIGTAATNTGLHATIKILDSTAKGTVTKTAIVTNTVMCQTAGFARHKLLEIRAENVGKNCSVGTTRGRYVRARAIAGTRAAQFVITAIGVDPRFGPQSNTVTTTAT